MLRNSLLVALFALFGNAEVMQAPVDTNTDANFGSEVNGLVDFRIEDQ
jgi:hypothetical protein